MSRERTIKKILGFIYLFASLINLTISFLNVEIYREWQHSALLALYRNFMEHISTPTLRATILLVVIYQLIAGLSLLSRSYARLGLCMAALFHFIILPWGYFALPGLLFLLPLYYVNRNLSYDTPEKNNG